MESGDGELKRYGTAKQAVFGSMLSDSDFQRGLMRTPPSNPILHPTIDVGNAASPGPGPGFRGRERRRESGPHLGRRASVVIRGESFASNHGTAQLSGRRIPRVMKKYGGD